MQGDSQLNTGIAPNFKLATNSFPWLPAYFPWHFPDMSQTAVKFPDISSQVVTLLECGMSLNCD